MCVGHPKNSMFTGNRCAVYAGFRVHVKEALGLPIGGAVDLVLGSGRLALHTPDTGYHYICHLVLPHI